MIREENPVSSKVRPPQNLDTTQLLDLRSIASWRVDCLENGSGVKASIPALQRGLVWRPQQIELLWDSIFRGFPIGSLVACRPIANQERAAGETCTHHLLDGQQRSQAISLAYAVPDFSSREQGTDPDILWLDLSSTHIPKDSTRKFLFRLTKRAHPWGYQPDDICTKLQAYQIRSSLEGVPRQDRAQVRPQTVELQPYVADKPVPVGLLMRCTGSHDAIHFCERLAAEIRAVRKDMNLPWAVEALALLADTDWRSSHLAELWEGLQRVERARLVLLEVPKDLIGEDDNLGQEQMSNVEHLFQRLNTQGSALSAEELVYSMIKAYYPQVSATVDAITPLRMKPSRLVNIAVRAVLTKPESDTLHNGYSVARLRSIALSHSAEFGEIVAYLSPDGPLRGDLQYLDDILIYANNSNPNGLPASVVSSIARRKPELFLLLLSWVRNQREAVESLRAFLPGLLSLLSCFGWKRVEVSLLQCTKDGLSSASIRSGIACAVESEQMARIQSPRALAAQLPDFTTMECNETFKKWNAWSWLIEKETDEDTQHATVDWWYFSERFFVGNLRQRHELQEMLLYSQRRFLDHRFSGYDQANSQLWEDHDRPWDYDHILPYEVSYNKRHKEAPFKAAVDRWINTLGNFWACPFEDNRSYGNMSLSEKRGKGGGGFLSNAFIDEAEFNGFNGHCRTLMEPMAAREFAEATKNRMLRIYSEWYDAAKIGDLLEATPQSPRPK